MEVKRTAVSEKSEVTKVIGHLMKELDSDFCTSCGTCVISCPFDSIELEEDGPALRGICTACGLCYAQCPQFTRVQEDAEKIFGERPDFKGIGLYENAYSARSKLPEVRENAQDGGIVTTLLYTLLNSGFIDAAVVTGEGDGPWKPDQYVVILPDEVKEYGGTIYSPSSILMGVEDAVELYGREKIAVVGTPCQVKGLRQMEIADIRSEALGSRVKLIIGLFCMESYPYENVKRILEDKLDLDISEVSKFNIEKGNFIVLTEKGEEKKIPVKKLKDFMCSFCTVCLDFSAELADISVGNVGVPEGYCSVLTRTEIGEEAFQKAMQAGTVEYEPLTDVEPGLEHVEKLSNSKKRERMEEIERRKGEGKPVPPRAEGVESD